MQAAIILLGITALGGVAMAWQRWRGAARPPHWLAMLHGLLAAAGLTLLLYEALTVGVPVLAQASLALFGLAALGGVWLNLRYHVNDIPLPKGIIVAHALLALLAYGLLVLAQSGAA